MKDVIVEANCIVCGSDAKKVLLDLDFLKETHNAMSLVRCRRCGFEHIESRRTGDELQEQYNEDYYQNGYLKYEGQRIKQFELMCERLVNHGVVSSGKSLNVLDIGAGAGYFLKVLKDRFGANAFGVEPASFARNYARERFGVESFANVQGVGDASFDLISLWDVLGHVEDPREYLSFCRDHLREAGWLVIKFPNFKSSWHRFNFLQAKLRHINSIHATSIIWRFSKNTIGRILDQFGFRIEAVETVGHGLLSSGLSRKLRSVRCLTSMIDKVIDNRQEIIVYARKK